MRKILFILLTLALPAILFASEPVREWKSQSGKTIIEASLDVNSNSDPATVYLLKEGRRFRIPLKNLSDTDQAYVSKKRANRRYLDEDFGLEEVPNVDHSFGMNVVPSGSRYALLIGVNKYAEPIRSLLYCVNDMDLLSTCFQKTGVPKENIILMTDKSPEELRPTGANIRREIEKITQRMKSGDQLIIAFNGHGIMVDQKSYLCPSDTDLKDKNSVVSRDWVFDQMEKCKAKQKVIIIDACRSNFSFNTEHNLSRIKALEDPIGADAHGFILIAACDKSQFSNEHPDLQHGVFTYFFAKGISGEARDDDGYVTIMNLFQYASSKTKKFVSDKLNMKQVPTFRQGDEMTDFCLAKLAEPFPLPEPSSNAPASSEPSPNPETTPTPNPETPAPGHAGAKKTFTVNGVVFTFKWCPHGSFMMGSPESEKGHWKYEKQHQVTLTKGFWMMETEVTQKQWKAVMGDNPSEFQDENLPVENVSWFNCQDFCKRCARLGMPVQLPTEAQWEYACRAGSANAYAGNIDEMAWFVKNSGNKPHPVGKKKPNEWGLYDMHGNVLEWCQDRYDRYPDTSVTNPTGSLGGAEYVTRGGCWNDIDKLCRSARRSCSEPEFKSNILGLRCVIEQ